MSKSIKYKLVLSQDSKMSKLVNQYSMDNVLNNQESSFTYLCRSIISQQLSSKVASIIEQRFKNLFKSQIPTPEKVLKLEIEVLKSVGLSSQKSTYIKNLASYFLENKKLVKELPKLTNEEIIQHLTHIKGIGVWTVEMFLMFSLKREDIFSYKDLGLYTAVKKLYQVKSRTAKKEKEKILKISEQWSPYRTYACLYLWRWYEDGMPSF